MWDWWLVDNPSNSMLIVFFICNTINLIGCILLLAAIYKSEKKCKMLRKKNKAGDK